MKKLVLVFSPFCIQTSPPLGMAYLKSYLEQSKEINVKNLDLNLEFLSSMISQSKELFNYELDSERFANKLGLKAGSLYNIILENAQRVFRGETNISESGGSESGGFEFDEFYDAEKYDVYSKVYRNFFDKLKESTEVKLKEIIRTGEDTQGLLKNFIEKIKQEKPDVVGFSVIYEEQLSFSLALAKLVKKEIGTPILMGGGIASSEPEAILKTGIVDFIIYNEGEEALLALIEHYSDFDSKVKLTEDTGSFDKIPNLIYLRQGNLIKTSAVPKGDIDKIPFPDYSDFNIDSYLVPKKVFPILSSRGCYWRKCSFCTHHNTYSRFKMRSIQNIIDEINYLNKSYGVVNFTFVDEMISSKRFEQISKAIIDNNLSISYYAFAKPTPDFNKELLEQIYKSGCKALFWGIESASQRVLDLMNKGTKAEHFEMILKNSSESGIRNCLFVMFGFPSETKQEAMETINFLELNKNHIDLVLKNLYVLTKNSDVFDNFENYGINKIGVFKNKFPSSFAYEVNKGMSMKEAYEFVTTHLDFFYSLNSSSTQFNKFRDHMLLYFSKFSKNKQE